MELIFIVVFIVGFFYLIGRIHKLEERLNQLQGETQHQTSPQTPAPQRPIEAQQTPYPPHAGQTPVSAGPTPPAPPQTMRGASPVQQMSASFQPAVPPQPNAFMEWLKEDFFVKLGALLLLIAFGWFVSYAFANNWIGPMGRIALGLLAGVSIMALGTWRIKRYVHQGSIFTALGSTTVLLTIYAARELYEFFTPVTALGIMFLSVVYVAFVAVRYKNQNLALAGLILGAVAPLFTNTEPNVIGIFSYLMVLVLGSLWVVRLIGAIALPLASFLIVAFYGIPYLTGLASGGDGSVALFFAFAFTVIFFVSNTVSIITRTDDTARGVHILVALGTGLYLAGWVAIAVDSVWQSLVEIAWAIAFAFGAFVVYVRTNDRAPFYIYSAVAIGLLAIATAAELDGAVLTIAYTVEITTLLLAAHMLFRDPHVLNRLSILYVGPIVLSFEHLISRSWNDGFFHADFFALLILSFCMWVSAYVMFTRREKEADEKVDAAKVLSITGGLYAIALVWLVTHAVLTDDIATTISLFIYTVAGITLYVMGNNEQSRALRLSGGLLIGLVVARLLFVEVWAMALSGRIITFFVIGVLLISTAFMNKFKPSDHENQS